MASRICLEDLSSCCSWNQLCTNKTCSAHYLIFFSIFQLWIFLFFKNGTFQCDVVNKAPIWFLFFLKKCFEGQSWKKVIYSFCEPQTISCHRRLLAVRKKIAQQLISHFCLVLMLWYTFWKGFFLPKVICLHNVCWGMFGFASLPPIESQ